MKEVKEVKGQAQEEKMNLVYAGQAEVGGIYSAGKNKDVIVEVIGSKKAWNKKHITLKDIEKEIEIEVEEGYLLKKLEGGTQMVEKAKAEKKKAVKKATGKKENSNGIDKVKTDSVTEDVFSLVCEKLSNGLSSTNKPVNQKSAGLFRKQIKRFMRHFMNAQKNGK